MTIESRRRGRNAASTTRVASNGPKSATSVGVERVVSRRSVVRRGRRHGGPFVRHEVGFRELQHRISFPRPPRSASRAFHAAAVREPELALVPREGRSRVVKHLQSDVMERLVRLREPREAAHLHRLRAREGLAGSRGDASDARPRVAHAQGRRARRPARARTRRATRRRPRDVRGGGRRAGQREEREEREERRAKPRDARDVRASCGASWSRGGGGCPDAARRDLIEGNSGGAEKTSFHPAHAGGSYSSQHPRVPQRLRIGIRRITVCHLTARRACASRFPETRRLEKALRRLSSPPLLRTRRGYVPRVSFVSVADAHARPIASEPRAPRSTRGSPRVSSRPRRVPESSSSPRPHLASPTDSRADRVPRD